MNHRPFEDWLLDDERLTASQERDLHAHLRLCAQCASIAESNLALHSTRNIGAASGFVQRFTLRLAQRRRQQRWHQTLGTLVLVFSGLTLLYLVVGPAIVDVLRSPSAWLTAAVGYCVWILTAFQALSEVARILLRDLPGFITPTGWSVITALSGGLGGAWIALLRRFAQRSQGV
jgi:antibiotic biosynthesis monooxygenase (ABM) superfamily enzyme